MQHVRASGSREVCVVKTKKKNTKVCVQTSSLIQQWETLNLKEGASYFVIFFKFNYFPRKCDLTIQFAKKFTRIQGETLNFKKEPNYFVNFF